LAAFWSGESTIVLRVTRLLAVLAIAVPLIPLASATGSPVNSGSEAAATRAAASVAVNPRGRGPLNTGIFDPFLQDDPEATLGFSRVAKAGAHFFLLRVTWRSVAPRGDVKPIDFDASNPADPKYRFKGLDSEVKLVVASGLEPIVQVDLAPDWAAGLGTLGGRDFKPDPVELGMFATALARRYNGAFNGLPRVRYFGAWNEPNLPFSLEPQTVDGVPFAPGWYRSMVNAVADGVHGVDPTNTVIAGNLAPFTSRTGAADRWGLAPLAFMRSLLCLRKDLTPSCNDRVRFDIWAHHPYTSGGPTHHASRPDDVSLGDLGEMRQVLVAGANAGHIVSDRSIGFWVTEFSWDSNPPDPGGLKPPLLARWAAEALYRMWQAGVNEVTWFLLTDQPMDKYFAQSGLYYNSAPTLQGDKAKALLYAFRFPFVAYTTPGQSRSNRAAAYPKQGTNVLVWGRTPENSRARVMVQQWRAKRWRPVAVITTNRYGIFGRRLWVPTKGPLRARSLTAPATSRAFYLTRPKDRFVSPFGEGWTD
jgi:hypothetical protein